MWRWPAVLRRGVLLLGLAAGHGLAGEPLQVVGSSTLAPLLGELARRFQATYPGVAIAVEAGGSGRGVDEVRAGRADIGMVARALKPDEAGLFVFALAQDGIALAVHASNPLGGLSRQQAIDILTGKLGRWSQLGGAEAPISFIYRAPGHSTRDLVAAFFGLSPEEIKAGQLAGDNAEALRLLLANPNALTVISLALVEQAVEQGRPAKALALDGIPAARATVQAGSYPLLRPLNLVTKNVPAGAARNFLGFALSPAARETIVDYNFVPFGRR